MNVSRNAYYTTEFLQDRGYRHDKVLKIQPLTTQNDYIQAAKENAGENNGSRSSIHPTFESKKNVRSRDKSVKDKDDLHSEITPAELYHLRPSQKSRHEPKHSINYSDYYTPRKMHEGQEFQDELDIHDTRSGRLSFFRRKSGKTSKDSIGPESLNCDTALFRGDDALLYAPEPKPITGFYVDQQRRYDEAKSVKPDMHTHKTFDEVFPQDEHERLNPIDVVFDDPSTRNLSKKKKVRQALRSIKTKLGKNDYAHYDYTQRSEHDEPESLLVRSEFDDLSDSCNQLTSNLTTRDEAQDKEVNGQNTEPSHSSGMIRGLQNLHSSSIMPKMKTFDLGDACNSRPYSNEATFESQTELSGTGPGSLELIKAIYPLWAFMSSWLVDSNSPESHDLGCERISEVLSGDEGSIEEYVSTESTGISRQKDRGEKRLKRVGKKYKGFLQKWNSPAPTYKNMKSEPSTRALGRTNYGTGSVQVVRSEGQVVRSEGLENSSDVHLANINPQLTDSSGYETSPTLIISNVNKLIKNIKIMRVVFAPIDVIAENFPRTQTFVIIIELFIFMWILYELSLLIDALCMAVKAVCAPMIAVGKFMNRIV